eukprot:1158252-Pelagomonas_calceolata.AAC.1
MQCYAGRGPRANTYSASCTGTGCFRQFVGRHNAAVPNLLFVHASLRREEPKGKSLLHKRHRHGVSRAVSCASLASRFATAVRACVWV